MSDPAYPPLSPYLMVKRGPEALDWYVRAFGAEVVERYDMDDGRLGHATLSLNGGSLMLSDEFPELAEIVGTTSPETLGGTTSSVHLSVDDVDCWFDRAIQAGATAMVRSATPSATPGPSAARRASRRLRDPVAPADVPAPDTHRRDRLRHRGRGWAWPRLPGPQS